MIGKRTLISTLIGEEVVTSAEDYRLCCNGRSYIDLTCGTSATGFGHSLDFHLRVSKAIAGDVPWNTYDYPTLWQQRAVDSLQSWFPEYSFAFFSGGAEAVEAAIKIARQITGRAEIVYFDGAFHGKTYLTGLMSSGSEIPGVVRKLPYNEVVYRRAEASDSAEPAAFIVEPIQCRNGVRLAQRRFLESLVETEYPEDRETLVISDEISTSIRSGYRLAWHGVGARPKPDIICLGKNYGQGVPVSIVGVHETHVPKIDTLSLTSGFGANPIAMIAIAETLQYLGYATGLSRIRRTGEKFRGELRTLEKTGRVAVTGLGMWFGLTFANSAIAESVARRLFTMGYIVTPVGTAIRLSPPFELPPSIWTQFVRDLEQILVSYA